MRPTCGSCRWYEHLSVTDKVNPLTKRERPGGYCDVHRETLSEHTGVPRGRDLVDRSDWCQRWESAAKASTGQ